MTSFGDTPSEWLDDELRRVPLPQGMLARLRALATLSDEMLDSQLRNVPVPAGLIARLSRRTADPKPSPPVRLGERVAIDDLTLDRALRDVPVPEGLAAKLCEIAIERAQPLDEERLRDVSLPDGFMERLAHTALWATLSDPDIPEDAWAITAPRSRTVAAGGRLAKRPAAIVAMIAALSACYLLALGALFRHTYQDSPLVAPNVAVGRDLNPALWDQPDFQLISAPQPEAPRDSYQNIAGQIPVPWLGFLSEHEPDFFPNLNPVAPVRENEMLGTNPAQTPGPIKVASPAIRGLTPAWKDADLLLAQLKDGVHPFVPLSPTMDLVRDAAKLTCRVPTVSSTDSFDRAISLLGTRSLRGAQRQAAQRWLQAEVRPEEFLAAMDYGFTPAAPGSLELRTAGGVSPFGPNRQRLLQVAVVGGDVPPKSAQPCHLIVMLDCSSSMARSGNLEKASRAVVRFSRKLGPADRLSLVGYRNGQPEVLLGGVHAQQQSDLEGALAELVTPQDANLVDGLRQAVSVARRDDPNGATRRRIVVLSDADLEVNDSRDRLEPLLRQSAAAGTHVWVAALAEDEIGSAHGGRCAQLASSLEVDRFLTEALRDQPCVVAEDVHLSVKFNPQTVASYRLIGHEATSVLGVHTAELDWKVSAGEVCTGLFEVQIREGGDGLVGTVEVTWRQPLQSGLNRAVRHISRWQLADSFLETPPSVQTAALGAETAEILRRSKFAAGRGHSWSRVRQVAAEVHPQASNSDAFRRLMELVHRAEQWGAR